MSQQVIITSQRKQTWCLGTDKIQIGLRSRKRKDGAHPRSLGSSLGPLSTRQQCRHTPRSSHQGVPRKRTLQNQQPLMGSVQQVLASKLLLRYRCEFSATQPPQWWPSYLPLLFR